MFRYRIRSVVVAGIACTFVAWSAPIRAQEEEVVEEVPALEETIPGDPDPATAITTQTPDIPPDELALLIKPLTLEELEVEAAAWLLLLKQKQQEISEAEIAVKRQNLAITKEEEAAAALDAAKTELEAAEAAQAEATPGSPEAQEAAQKVEAAKEKLKEAQAAIQEAVETKQEMAEDEALTSALEKAEDTGELEGAKALIEETKTAREEMDPDSPEYEAITEKIDALDTAIRDVEKAKEDLEGTVPDTPEHEAATAELEAKREALKKAIEAISGPSEPEETDETEAIDEALDGDEQSEAPADATEEVAALLDGTEVDGDGQTQVAGPGETTDGDENLGEKGEKLEEASEKLTEQAEAEAEKKNQLVVAVTELQTERTAIVDRFTVVLDEMDKKGGDSTSYRKYVQAVSGIELDVQDTEGLAVRLISWAKSEEGGLRWATRVGTFFAVFLVTTLFFQIFGIILNYVFGYFKGMSSILRGFIVMVVQRGGIVVALLAGLVALQVPLGPLAALVGGASFVLAFALQSNLGNFASGLMLMVNKPFDVGDEVKVAGVWGWVKSIDLAGTKITGFDNADITIPNNMVWDSVIQNLTGNDIRKIGVTFKIGYDEPVARVKEVFLDVCKQHPKVDESQVFFMVWAYHDSAVEMFGGVPCPSDDYWDVYNDIYTMWKERCTQEGIDMVDYAEVSLRYAAQNGNGHGSVLKSPEMVKAMEPPAATPPLPHGSPIAGQTS